MRVEVITTLSYSVDLDQYINEFPQEFSDWYAEELNDEMSNVAEQDKKDFVSDTIDSFYGPYEIARASHIFREIGDDANVECY